MAYEKGGRADKYGNKFEYNWVVYNLLNIIQEKVVAVVIEALGEDERGVDLWVIDKDGSKDGQQCKGRSGSSDQWTFASANAKELWKSWKKQLDRGENISVSLVSPLSFTMLEDITTRARNNSGNPEEFYRIQILESGKDTQKFYNNVCNAIGIKPEDVDTPSYMLSYFKRIHYRQYPDTELKSMCLDKINLLFKDDKEKVYSLLLDYILTQDIYGKEITSFALNNYLRTKNIKFRNLANDERILSKIEELNLEYDDSFNIFSSGMIIREEAKTCWEYMKNGKSVVLYGKAGVGKSGCTTNIISFCKKENIPYLAINLDKRIPNNTTEEWGRNMGLPASISYCIDSITKDTCAVIILDQLDALRWTQANSALALTLCKNLIREVKSINDERNNKISIVFSCRRYDLENDPEISKIFEDKNKYLWEKILVDELSDVEIKQVVGSSFDELSTKVRKMLRIASNLYIWEKLDGVQNDESLNTSYHLVKRWWDQIVEKARFSGLESKCMVGIIENITKLCDTRGISAVPIQILNIPSDYKSFLISNGFIVESNNKVSFSHQSILDCFLAEQMIIRHFNGESLEGIIGDKYSQTPARRYQFQFFLQLLEETDVGDFLEFGKNLIKQTDIRYSFKYVLLEILSQNKEPIAATLEFVMELLKDMEWETPVINTVISGNKIYIKRMISEGILDKWISQGREDLVINLFVSLQPDDYDGEILNFIRKHALIDDSNKKWIYCFDGDIYKGSKELFELRLEFYKIHPKTLSYNIDLEKMLRNFGMRSVEILALMLEFVNQIENIYVYNYMEELCLDDTVIKDYMQVLDILVPYLPAIDKDSKCVEWSGQYNGSKNIQRLCILIIKAANREFIQKDYNGFKSYYSNYMGKGNDLYNEIILDAAQFIENEHADNLLNYLMADISNNCFEESSGNGNKLYYVKKIISKYSVVCSESVIKNLEDTVIHYISPRAKSILRNRIERNNRLLIDGGTRVYWDFWGDFQYEILSVINSKRRSEKSNQLLAVLGRKFAGKKSVYNCKYNTNCYNVTSPVSGKKLSGRNWMKIIMNPKIQDINKIICIEDEEICKESSLEEYLIVFRNFVESNPNEIVELFLEDANDIKDCFIDAMFGGLSSINQIDDQLCYKIKLLIKKFGYNYTSERAKYICKIVENNPEKKWSQDVLDCIKDIALMSRNLEVPQLDINEKCDSLEMLEFKALNCVCGQAIKTIAKLLWVNVDHYAQFKECISELTNGENPIIRYVLLWAIWPVYYIEKTWAIEKIMHIFDSDYKTISFPESRRVFCNCYLECSKQICEVIDKAVQTKEKRLITVGGYSIVELYMLYDAYDNLLDIYKKAGNKLRFAMLEMLIIYLGEYKYKEKAKNLLAIIVDIEDDLDNFIIWGRIFRNGLLDVKEDSELITKIVISKLNRETLTGFSEFITKHRCIKEYSDTIIDIGNAVLKKDCVNDKQLWGIDSEVSKLIFGLYDYTYNSSKEEDKNISNSCLDIWDRMYECNIGMARHFTDKVTNME